MHPTLIRESHRSPFSITTTACCILSTLPSCFQVKSRGFFCLFSFTLCLQSPVAPGFWSLLEFLSPTKVPTGSAMFLDHHYWTNGALLRKDYSFPSLCHCCPVCAAFLQPGVMTWQKPLGGNKSRRKRRKAFPIQAVGYSQRSGRTWLAVVGLVTGISSPPWPYLHCQGTALPEIPCPGNCIGVFQQNLTGFL